MYDDLKVKFFKFYDYLEDGDMDKAVAFFQDPLHYGKTGDDQDILNDVDGPVIKINLNEDEDK
jgi:hypothetical protein